MRQNFGLYDTPLPEAQRRGYARNIQKGVLRLEQEGEEPEWPRVRCATAGCDKVASYKKTRLTVTPSPDAEPSNQWEDRHLPRPQPVKTNHCWKCVKKSHGLETDGEAMALCAKHVPAYRDSREHTVKHKAVHEEVKRMKKEGLRFQ